MYRVWIPQSDRVILARDVILNENELYCGGKDVDESVSLFEKVPRVRRGRPRKEVLIAPAVAPAPAPVPLIEEEVLIGDLTPDPTPITTPEVPAIIAPAPTRTPTPSATVAPVRELSPVVEERPVSPVREASLPPPAPTAPAPTRAPPATAPSRSRYGRERRAPAHY